MTRSELIARFREENPDVTDRVATDAVLHNWLQTGDKEVCAATRCIVGEETLTSVVSTTIDGAKLNLTSLISNFYDIDELVGGGVCYDGRQIESTSPAKLYQKSSAWRSRSAGTPRKYYRRNQYLYFDRPCSAAKNVLVYTVLISDDFDDDDKTPYNQLLHLEPFHPALIAYLKMRAKGKIGKYDEKMAANAEYNSYVKWMAKQIGGTKYTDIQLKPGYKT